MKSPNFLEKSYSYIWRALFQNTIYKLGIDIEKNTFFFRIGANYV